MGVKVLIVDDSSFFRRRVTEIINQDKDMEVVGAAVNGKEAIEKTIALRPDVITMDVEMPVMDGITSVREIMKAAPTPILMFSSLTHQGAKATLEALDAGALDFLPKKFEDIARDKNEAVETLQQRVKAIARKRTFNRPIAQPTAKPGVETAAPVSPSTNQTSARAPAVPAGDKSKFTARASATSRSTTSQQDVTRNPRKSASAMEPKISPVQRPVKEPAVSKPAPSSRKSSRIGDFKLLAIGTSTGGPVALQTILTALPQNYPKPILLIQHMPATFTAAFASRLNTLCKITVKEAADGDVLKPGVAYLAPGGKQMLIDGTIQSAKLKIKADDSARITYKPSVDITFGSAAKVYKDQVLAVVLTGMGADGREGARMLKKLGSRIWAQDEQSCVVYGMPQAVSAAGLTEADFSLSEMADQIIKEAGYG